MAAPRHDVIVVGLGAMGSAAVWQLASRGVRTIGFDRYDPPHTLGSTHGKSRIIREAYFEHPAYVPLLRRAYELWDEMERDAGTRVFRQTGGLMAGPEGGMLVSGAFASAREHGVAHEMLSASAVERRFPAFRMEPGMVALLEQRAGMLDPERSISAFLALARSRGADLRTGVRVLRWHADGSKDITVETTDGEFRAEKLVIAAGPWVAELAPELAHAFTIERQVFHWFAPRANAGALAADRCPVALWEYGAGDIVATQPDTGDGFKIGIHHAGEITSTERIDRIPRDDDEAAARDLLARFVPDANGRLRDAAVCVYTNTPDEHFVIGALPTAPNVILASPCSGHGFKFAPVVGEIVADLATRGSSGFDLGPFLVTRLIGRHAETNDAGFPLSRE